MKQSDKNVENEYSITFEKRTEYLYVYVTGEHDTFEISYDYWQKVAEMCKQNDFKKVLIEEDIPESGSMADVYKLASELPSMGFLGVRVAFVDRYAEQQDLNEFGELVAVNRGLFGKVFNNFEEGERWLTALP